MDKLEQAFRKYFIAAKTKNKVVASYWNGYIDAWEEHLLREGATQDMFDRCQKQARIDVAAGNEITNP